MKYSAPALLVSAFVLAATQTNAGMTIAGDAITPGGFDTLTLQGSQGNVLAANNAEGGRVFNVSSDGQLFVTMTNNPLATRLVLQNQRTGAFHTSGKLNHSLDLLFTDGQDVRFLIQEVDKAGTPTGQYGYLGKDDVAQYVLEFIAFPEDAPTASQARSALAANNGNVGGSIYLGTLGNPGDNRVETLSGASVENRAAAAAGVDSISIRFATPRAGHDYLVQTQIADAGTTAGIGFAAVSISDQRVDGFTVNARGIGDDSGDLRLIFRVID